MNTARANIINALHALENGKSAVEVTAWLKDAIIDLAPPAERPVRNPVIEGYAVSQEGSAVWVVRYPVHVRTLDDAIDYIKLVINLK